MITQAISDYYKRRAKEYEKIYFRNDPIRQDEQRLIIKAMQNLFEEKEVLEVACGTGYWTEFLSQTAKRITATDYVEEVLKIAKAKKYLCLVKFKKEDAYKLSFRKSAFSGGVANLWISHVPKEKLHKFLIGFHQILKKDSVIFFVDNVYVRGVGGKLVRKKGDRNTYKLRELSDSTKTEVLKNYFTIKQLKNLFTPYAKEDSIKIFYGKCFWYVTYIKK